MATQRGFRFAGLAFGLACLLSLAGCLEGFKAVLFRYDPQKDQFAALTVYQQIRASGGDEAAVTRDFEHLKNVYAQRDHLIVGDPRPSLPEMGLLRLGPDKLALLNVTEAKPTEVVELPAALPAELRILPGIMFLASPDNLVYFHQVVLPGPVMDLALANGGGFLAPQGLLATLVKQERLRRTDPKKSAGTWKGMQESLQSFTIAGIVGNPELKAGLGGNRENPLKASLPQQLPLPFSDATLGGIATALAKGELRVTRKAKTITFSLPCTKDEARQFAKVIATVREDATAKVRGWLTPMESVKDLPLDALERARAFAAVALEALASLEAHPTETGVALSMDVVALFNTLSSDPTGALPGLEAADTTRAKDLAQRVTNDFALPKDLTVAKVVEDFRNGQLKAYPPEKSLTPGEGMELLPPGATKNQNP